MALTATIYNFTIELSDVDRGVYETLELRVARHPSETAEFMLTRILAYCLEYTEGIAFTDGVSAGDEAAVIVRDLTGRVAAWIEVGAPDAERVHRASKLADRVAIYTHRHVPMVLDQLSRRKIHRAENVPLYSFGNRFIDNVAAALDRRNAIVMTVTEGQLYLDVAGQSFHTTIEQHRLESPA
jgi:uncharacterized protein YaeQ